MSDLEKISFLDDNNEPCDLYVWAETKVNGVNYLLVSETEDEDADMYIFKEVALSEDADEVSYEPVEEDSELDYIGGIFSELLAEEE